MKLGELLRECSSCFWYDGDVDDDNAFCDEKEVYVEGTGCCNKWKTGNKHEHTRD